MSIEDLPSLFRNPRIQVEINGWSVNSVLHAEVITRAFGRSSNFELTLSISTRQAENQWLEATNGVVGTSMVLSDPVSGEKTRIFEGLADSLDFNPLKKVAIIRGRDYSSLLSTTIVQQSFSNLTASEVASVFAARHGLEATITPTYTRIGSYRGGSHNQMLLNAHSRFTNEWGLLRYLAQIEDLNLAVEGKTLIFGPSLQADQPRMVIDVRKTESIKFRRICPLSYQTKIVVKSWNTWQAEAVTHEEYQNPAASSDKDISASGSNEGNVFLKPNLSATEAERWAGKYMRLLQRRSVGVDILMPGETSLRSGDVIAVTGSGTSFDQDYIIVSLRRCFSPMKGLVQYLHAEALQAQKPVIAPEVL